MKIHTVTHPDYNSKLSDWEKFRLTYKGGKEFIKKYLKQFSNREDYHDFMERKAITYAPAYAKAAVIDIKNSIHQRMADVSRKGGSPAYNDAISGKQGGVDRLGNSMNSFMGNIVLDELLPMASVGIFVDKPEVVGQTKNDTKGIRPYLYIYKAEEIRSYNYNENAELDAVLLKHTTYKKNDFGLPEKEVVEYLLYRLIDGVVYLAEYDREGKKIRESESKLNKIPFVMLELTQSLMTDIADYQIAALNLASCDMNYAQKSNYPFYTEQYSPEVDLFLGAADDTSEYDEDPEFQQSGSEASAGKASDPEIKVGATQGRRYPKGLNAPAFINPSPEPLQVSMAKQKVLKEETRELVNLNLASLQSRRASAESKEQDTRGKEEGLSYIGLELEYAERQIAEIWAMYEGTEPATVQYPLNYSLKTDSERRDEASNLLDQADRISSLSLKKALAKQATTLLVGHRVPQDDLESIHQEIDKSEFVISTPETIINDLEAGLVSVEFASQLRGYPKGQVEEAKKDHEERLLRIAEAQGGDIDAARGGEGEGITGGEERAKERANASIKGEPAPVRGES